MKRMESTADRFVSGRAFLRKLISLGEPDLATWRRGGASGLSIPVRCLFSIGEMNTTLNPKRTVTELKELRELTGDENGAQRVAFTPTWAKARAWLRRKLGETSAEIHTDEAGNLWAALRGESEKALLIGGHIDSVPNGGWLDGSLDTLAGLEILRRLDAQYHGKPPVTVRLVDWADEEGARFGKSLFGSSACSGHLDMDEARGLKDKEGITLPAALAANGIDFEKVKDCHKELANAAAYLELHIEQGPVLLDLDRPLATVIGTFGVERHAITFHGQAAHAGSTPMNKRKDAFLAAAKMSPEIYRITERHGGVCTIGSCTTNPGFVTSVIEECRITLDQRHLDAARARPNAARSKGRQRTFCEGRKRHASRGSESGKSNRSPFTPISSPSAMKPFCRDAAPFRIACPPARCTTPPKSRAPAFPAS